MFDEADLAGLTEAEKSDLRIEIEGETDVPDDDDDAAAAAAAAAATAAAGAAGAGADAANGAAAGAGTAAAPSAEGAVDDEPAPASAIIAPAVEGFEDRIKALNAEKSTALQKMMDGDITAEEFAETDQRVSKELTDLTIAQRTHEADTRRAQQSAEQDWQRECARFMRSAKEQGIDYAGNRALGAALDAEVRALAGDPKHAAKSGDWFLREAHKAVTSAFGIKPSAAPAAPQQPAKRAPDLSGIPPSIAHAPVAAEAAPDGSEFAFLNNLDGSAYEKAIARMTTEQRERFMAV